MTLFVLLLAVTPSSVVTSIAVASAHECPVDTSGEESDESGKNFSNFFEEWLRPASALSYRPFFVVARHAAIDSHFFESLAPLNEDRPPDSSLV